METRVEGISPIWFLYLLECRDSSIYTGVARDVERRFAAHCAGKGARYTRAHPPLRILAATAIGNRSQALSAEYRIKQLTAAEKRRLAADPDLLRDYVRSSKSPG